MRAGGAPCPNPPLAAYDEAVANYRQAALTAFQEVEDNLATLRVLEEQSQAQRVAVEAAQQSLDLSLNRYKGGLVTYLEVITAQSIALQNQIHRSRHPAPADGCQRAADQSPRRRLGCFQAAGDLVSLFTPFYLFFST